MKTIFCAFCLLCATAAFGQVGSVLSSEIQVIQPTSHPQHAWQRPMADEQSLLITSPFTSAQGERPLWEFASPKASVPLGDMARLLRKEHETAKKAVKVYVN